MIWTETNKQTGKRKQIESHGYQDATIEHILNNEAVGLFLDMGLGKTVTTLTGLDILLFDQFKARKILIIAPKRVAQTVWSDEIQKWDHTRHLRISKVLGTEKERKQALKVPADIYITNRENTVWLITLFQGSFPFDTVVIDELSSFKNASSKRFKALRMVRPKIKRVIGLTGTPAPNSLLDLWAPMYLLDQGQRLGTTETSFKEAYFTPKHNRSGFFGGFEIRKDVDKHTGPSNAEKEIYSRISDICISMKAKDYLELPGRIDQIEYIDLPADVKNRYDDFEEEQVLKLLELGPDEIITAINSGALNTKLAQFANGAMYREDRSVYPIHDYKLEAIAEMIEALNGKPAIIFYWFQHDRDRLLFALKEYAPRLLRDGKHTDTDISDWNAGKIDVLLLHPLSAAHGLNMQDGGNHSFWYSNTWSAEAFLQGCGRIDRQGQTQIVINKRLVCRGTIDEEMIKTIDGKIAGQDNLMDGVSYTKMLLRKHANKSKKYAGIANTQ